VQIFKLIINESNPKYMVPGHECNLYSGLHYIGCLHFQALQAVDQPKLEVYHCADFSKLSWEDDPLFYHLSNIVI
jgi:hypothetical protein